MHYATSTMQAPKYAQPGKEAMELEVILELKVIADVGLVGFPECREIHLPVPCDQCQAEDRELSFHDADAESRAWWIWRAAKALSSRIFRA